ncbi:hypothetical protein D3C75_384880 [compost metagenome]
MFRQFQMAFDEVAELGLGRGVVEVCVPQGLRGFATQVAHLVLLEEIPASIRAFAQVAQAALLADVHHALFKQIVQIALGGGFAVQGLLNTQRAAGTGQVIRAIAQLQRDRLRGRQAFDGPGSHVQFRSFTDHHVFQIDRQHVLTGVAFDFAFVNIYGAEPFSGLHQQWRDIGHKFRWRCRHGLTEMIFAAGGTG